MEGAVVLEEKQVCLMHRNYDLPLGVPIFTGSPPSSLSLRKYHLLLGQLIHLAFHVLII